MVCRSVRLCQCLQCTDSVFTRWALLAEWTSRWPYHCIISQSDHIIVIGIGVILITIIFLIIISIIILSIFSSPSWSSSSNRWDDCLATLGRTLVVRPRAPWLPSLATRLSLSSLSHLHDHDHDHDHVYDQWSLTMAAITGYKVMMTMILTTVMMLISQVVVGFY